MIETRRDFWAHRARFLQAREKREQGEQSPPDRSFRIEGEHTVYAGVSLPRVSIQYGGTQP